MKTVTLWFPKIGRTARDVEQAFTYSDPYDLEAKIARFASKFTASKGVDVVIADDTDKVQGIVTAGFHTIGSFEQVS